MKRSESSTGWSRAEAHFLNFDLIFGFMGFVLLLYAIWTDLDGETIFVLLL